MHPQCIIGQTKAPKSQQTRRCVLGPFLLGLCSHIPSLSQWCRWGRTIHYEFSIPPPLRKPERMDGMPQMFDRAFMLGTMLTVLDAEYQVS